jgi:hypothetical protein
MVVSKVLNWSLKSSISFDQSLHHFPLRMFATISAVVFGSEQRLK